MKLHEIGTVENCVRKNYSGGSLENVYLDVQKQRLVATDGVVMVVTKVEPDKEDQTGLITPEAMKAARTAIGKNTIPNGVSVIANGRVEITDLVNGRRTAFDRPIFSGSYVNYEAAIPDVSGPPDIYIDVQKLAQVAAALKPGNKQVALWLPKVNPKAKVDPKNPRGKSQAIVVAADPYSPSIGIVMPISVTEKGWNPSLKSIDEAFDVEIEKRKKAANKKAPQSVRPSAAPAKDKPAVTATPAASVPESAVLPCVHCESETTAKCQRGHAVCAKDTEAHESSCEVMTNPAAIDVA